MKKLPKLKTVHTKAWKLFSNYIRSKDADWGGYVACITCKKPFRYKKKRLKEGNPKFCSSKCVRHSEKTKQKIRDAIIKLGIMPITPTGKNHHNWKGDDVGYVGVHHWLRSKYGYANKCETCGKLGEKVNGIWNIQWANKTGKYLRKRNDFQGLCVSCHKKYDLNRLSN